MAHKKFPSYTHHKPSNQARVRIDGRDHWLGVYGSAESHAEYARLAAEWAAAGKQLLPKSQDCTVCELVAAYLKYAGTYYVKGGEQTRQVDRVRRALAPVRRLYGAERARDFGPRALKAVRQSYIDAGHCRTQCNTKTYCVVAAFRWAASEEMIPGAVVVDLEQVGALHKGRTEAHETRGVLPADEAHVERTLAECNPIVADMVRVQLLTAARPGEVTALRAADLDRSGAVWLWRPASHKTQHHDRDRLLFVGPKCQQILAPYLDRRGEAYLFSPREWVAIWRARQRAARKSKVQPSQASRAKPDPARTAGGRYTTDSYGTAVRAACRAAGVPIWSPGRLRHNAATRIVAQFGWEVARIVLSHSSIDTTRIYAADDTAKAVEAMRQVG